ISPETSPIPKEDMPITPKTTITETTQTHSSETPNTASFKTATENASAIPQAATSETSQVHSAEVVPPVAASITSEVNGVARKEDHFKVLINDNGVASSSDETHAQFAQLFEKIKSNPQDVSVVPSLACFVWAFRGQFFWSRYLTQITQLL